MLILPTNHVHSHSPVNPSNILVITTEMTVKMSATFFKCRRHLRRHFLTKNVGDIMSATLESCGMRATFFTIFGCKIWMIFGYKIFDGNSGGIRFGCKHRQKYMLEFCQNFGYNSGIAKFCFWARMTQNFNQNLPYFFLCCLYRTKSEDLSAFTSVRNRFR